MRIKMFPDFSQLEVLGKRLANHIDMVESSVKKIECMLSDIIIRLERLENGNYCESRIYTDTGKLYDASGKLTD